MINYEPNSVLGTPKEDKKFAWSPLKVEGTAGRYAY